MSIMAEPECVDRRDHSFGARSALLVVTSPHAVFERAEGTGSYGRALVTILAVMVLIGYVEAQSGLIDRTVDQQTEAALAALEDSQAHLVDRIELRERMDDLRKTGEFNKLVHRLAVIVFAPIYLLASFLFIASILYAVVALTGRKPEYHTLMSICVYSGFIELFGYIVRLAMVMYYRTTEVNTSLGMLAAPGQPSPLVAVDPFRFWFWVLVGIGLVVTHQLSRRIAVVACTLMALVGAGVHVAMAFLQKA